MNYTPEEHRAALGDLARDICLHMELCPDCGEGMEYRQADWEGDAGNAYGLSLVPAGWGCPCCGKFIEDERGSDE